MAEKVESPVVETKPTTKKKDVKKEKAVVLQLDGKTYEIPVSEKLPPEFLQEKLKEGQSYIPIGVYREIMRQLDEFDVPEFTEEKIMTWNNKYNVAQVVYKMYCEVKWYKYGRGKEPVVLKWHWYSSMSAWVLLSDAVHGNMMTLEAKALRAALRYSYRIFEFPEIEVYDDWKTEWTIKEKTATKIEAKPVKTEEEKATTQQVVDDIVKEDTDIETKIKDRYGVMMQEYGKELLTSDEKPSKERILAMWTKLKEEFGEQYKKFIISLIMPDIKTAEWDLQNLVNKKDE